MKIPKQYWTEERNNKLSQLVKNGVNLKDIFPLFGISRSVVYSQIRGLNLQLKKIRPKCSEETKKAE